MAFLFVEQAATVFNATQFKFVESIAKLCCRFQLRVFFLPSSSLLIATGLASSYRNQKGVYRTIISRRFSAHFTPSCKRNTSFVARQTLLEYAGLLCAFACHNCDSSIPALCAFILHSPGIIAMCRCLFLGLCWLQLIAGVSKTILLVYLILISGTYRIRNSRRRRSEADLRIKAIVIYNSRSSTDTALLLQDVQSNTSNAYERYAECALSLAPSQFSSNCEPSSCPKRQRAVEKDSFFFRTITLCCRGFVDSKCERGYCAWRATRRMQGVSRMRRYIRASLV